MDIKHEVARSLLSIEAVFLRPQEPFTWASGIKSPIYCDNRLILTAPEARDLVEHAIAETVRREYPQAQVLMGTATAGIAHAAIAAHLLGLPMGYVRSSSKDHGRQNRIEGKLVPGQKVVVVEDLISTGGSVLDAVDALREAGAEVLGVVSIFTYGMKKGVERLAAAQVRNVSLTDLDTVARTGAQEGYITEDDVARLLASAKTPPTRAGSRQKVRRDMKHLIDIMQLTPQEIMELIDTACAIMEHPEQYATSATGRSSPRCFSSRPRARA